jgi:hypothetical protein
LYDLFEVIERLSRLFPDASERVINLHMAPSTALRRPQGCLPFTCTRVARIFHTQNHILLDLRASEAFAFSRAFDVTFSTLLIMRSFLYIILAFSPFIGAFPEVDLLLPGFHDQKLQAGVQSKVFSISRSKGMSLN